MQTREHLHNSITTHTHTLLFKLGRNQSDVIKVTNALKNKSILDAIHFAWTLIDELEPHYPNANEHFMHARIELHSIQDDYYLLESRELWNENSLLASKLLLAEEEKERLQSKLEKTKDSNAALLLALRRQQQLTEELRSQLLRADAASKEHNPHSPYVSPSFAHNNYE